MSNYCKHCDLRSQIRDMRMQINQFVEERDDMLRQMKHLNNKMVSIVQDRDSLKERNLRMKGMIVDLQNRLGLANVDRNVIEEICYDIDE